VTGSMTCATQPLGLELLDKLLVNFEGDANLLAELSFGMELAGLLGQFSVVTFVALRRHCRKVWKGNGDGRGLLS
jgi:hypothetical protein